MDAVGNACVAGFTNSGNFPIAGLASQPANAGGFDVFVTHLDPTSARIYSTYLGGSGTDFGFGIALDGTESAYVTGETSSTNFPVAGLPSQRSKSGGADAFVMKTRPDLRPGVFHISRWRGGGQFQEVPSSSGSTVDPTRSAPRADRALWTRVAAACRYRTGWPPAHATAAASRDDPKICLNAASRSMPPGVQARKNAAILAMP